MLIRETLKVLDLHANNALVCPQHAESPPGQQPKPRPCAKGVDEPGGRNRRCFVLHTAAEAHQPFRRPLVPDRERDYLARDWLYAGLKACTVRSVPR